MNSKIRRGLDLPGYRQVKKDVHYTVTPINDIEAWRYTQELTNLRHEEDNRKRANNVKAALQGSLDAIHKAAAQLPVDATVEQLEAQIRANGDKTLDVEAVKRLDKATKLEKRAFSKTKSLKNYWVNPTPTTAPQPTPVYEETPTLLDRAKSAIKSLWDSAFRND